MLNPVKDFNHLNPSARTQSTMERTLRLLQNSMNTTIKIPKHSNAVESQENGIKNNFMKMIEDIKEQLKKSFKAIKEKINNIKSCKGKRQFTCKHNLSELHPASQ